jgi:hypothetical protein
VTLYVNGDKIAKKNISANSNYQFAVRNFTMGKVAYGGNSIAPTSFFRPFLYDGTLSDADVKKVFLGNVPKVSGSGATLKCYFPEGLTDVSGNGNDLVAYDTSTANFTNHRVVTSGVTPNMDNIMTCNPLTGNGEHTMNVYFDNKMFEITAQSRENSASTTGTHFNISNTFDPRKSSNARGWCTAPISINGGFPHYLTVKFPEAKYVSNCFIIEADPNGGVHRTNSNQLVTGFTIDASTDGTSWSTKYTSSSGIGNSGKQFDLTSPGTFQYWRLGITGSSVDYFGIGFWDIISNNFSVDGPSATSLAKFSSDLTSAPTSASTTGTITYSSDGAVHAASSSLVFPFTVDTADTFSVSFIGKGMSTSQSGFIQSTANSGAPEMEGVLAGSTSFWVRPCNFSLQQDRGKSPGYMNNSDWTHYVYTLSPCGFNLYINGVLRLAKLFNSARGGTTGITTFNVNTSNMFNANGILGKFKAYSNVLDYHQVTELYHADTPGISDLLVQPDPITFDGYNKLTLSGLTNPTSKIHALPTGAESTTTYDIGTATNVYIDSAGTYTAEMKGSDGFAIDSNVVSQVKLPDVVTVDWNTTSLSSITASNGDTLTTNVGGTWDVQTDSTMGKMVHIQTATTSRKFEIENSTQSLTSFVGTGDGVTISFYMKSGNPLYGSPKWFNDLFRVTGAASGPTPNVYAQVTYDTGQTYSVTHDKWMYVQISYKWDGSNFVDYTFYIIDENGDQEVKVSKSNVTTNNGLQSSNKFWETNNKWFNMEVATFRGDINLDFYLTNFRFENKYRSEFYWKGVPPSTTGSGLPTLTFDGYNKYTFPGADTGSTYKLKYLSNTYDLGTASTAYIKDAGTYSAEIKGATNFALSSNVVSGTIPPYKTILKIQDILGTAANERFGYTDYEGTGSLSFSKDGTRLVVGAWMYNSQQGRFYIYTFSGGQYVLDSGMPIDGTSGSHLGYCVNLNDDGTKVGIGTNGSQGWAKVYERSASGSWSLRGSTFGSGTNWTRGVVLDASGDRALGSALGDNTLKLFDWNGGSSAYTETTTFSGSGSFGGGHDMTRDGLTVIGMNRDSNATVKAWKYANGSWSQLGSDISVGDMTDAIHMARGTGTRFVVGANAHNSSTGILKLYEYSGSSWSKIQEWTGYTSGVSLGIDHSISDDGTIIIAGSNADDTGSSGSNAGMISIFTETNGIWEEKRFFGDTDNDQLGYGVTMSYDGGFYAACAPNNDEAASDAGKVRIYQNKNVLDFDGYNKLTFSGLESGSTSNVLFNGKTYSIGTASNVYIENTGTYEAESKGTTTFALTSNVVSGSIIEKPYNATSIVSWTNLGTTLTSDTNNITFSGYVDWDTTGTVSTSFDSTNNAIVFGGGNVGLQADFTSLRSDRNSNLWVEYEVYVTSGDMRSMLGIGKSGDGENDWFHWHDHRVYVWGANVGTGWNVPTGQWVKLAWKSDYIGSGNRRVSALLDSGNGYEEIAYHTGAPMSAGSNYLHSTGVLSYIRLFYTADTTGASTTGNKIRNIHIFSDQSDVPTSPPSLTHDGYKLVVKNITPTSTSLRLGSNTYEIGSATNIYVKDTGAYTAEIGNATDFAFTSNTVSGTIKTIEPGFASRYQGSMALTYDGKLYGWGMNNDGEAGVGTSSDITVPTLCTGITQGTVAKHL